MIISSKMCGMGDILLLTACAKHVPDCEIQIPPQASKFARFFRDISKNVVITENITPTPDIGPGHYAIKKLRALGLENKCYLPYVHLTTDEKTEALNLVKTYKNPIVFVGNVAKHWKQEREPRNKKYFQSIINYLSETHTVLQFGISSNFTEYANTIKMIDIPINDLIKYYYGIGKFVGVDTGDTHLMLAVGGYCEAHIPRYGPRSPEEWNYNTSRIKYYYFN